jgi:hypothetical protein
MDRKIFTRAILLVLLPTLASAQGDERARGERACKADVNRHCKKVLGQGDMAILQCLQSNKASLSRPCSTFLKEVGQLQ